MYSVAVPAVIDSDHVLAASSGEDSKRFFF
jgi:hypothetical protein